MPFDLPRFSTHHLSLFDVPQSGDQSVEKAHCPVYVNVCVCVLWNSSSCSAHLAATRVPDGLYLWQVEGRLLSGRFSVHSLAPGFSVHDEFDAAGLWIYLLEYIVCGSAAATDDLVPLGIGVCRGACCLLPADGGSFPRASTSR